ncbi:MAG: GNAT family N-acetyltransferase [Rhabdochlamydiaceae bacterium]|jgi:GNAT superfamily N-acetyltransferase
MTRIRKANDLDTPQLEELYLITRQQTFTWEKSDKFKLEDYKKATEGETVFVAEDDHGKIIGFVSVWEQDHFPFVHHLFIASDHQRKGIGEMLIKNLFSWLPRPYRLKCIAKNLDAIAFYLKNNWIEVGRGVGEDGEYLLLELPAYHPFSNNES